MTDRLSTVFPTISLKCLFLDPYSFPVVKFCHYLIFVPVVGAVWGISVKVLTLLHREFTRRLLG